MKNSGFGQPLRRSYVFNTGSISGVGRSFISTAIVNDSVAYNDDLRGSRIQNLPSYRKINLGENVNFVVVFQAIQIERLSRQVEVLRVRIKEQERQLFNAQNYEVQIRELTEKCFTQERDLEEFRDEYEKLNKICETLYNENQMLKKKLDQTDYSLKQKYEAEKERNGEMGQQIQKWKARYEAAERGKEKELQDLKGMMESQRKSMISREMRELSIRFQNQRSGLEGEIRKLREQLEGKIGQVEDWRQQCRDSEIALMQLRNFENSIADQQNKMALLNQQLLRLNQILKNKDEQLQNSKNNELKLGQQLKELKEWQYEGKQMKNALEAKNREVERWRTSFSRMEEQAVKGRDLEHYNAELTQKLELASQELERLQKLLRVKLDEIEEWKRRVTDRDAELGRLGNLESEIESYKSKINMQKVESQRINGIQKSRLAEIEDWKSKYHALEQTVSLFETLEKDKRAIEERCGQQVRQNEDLTYRIGVLEGELNTTKRSESTLRDMERHNLNLTKQVERVNGLLKSQGGQLNDYRLRHSQLESALESYRSVQGQLRDYDYKVKLLTTELQKLNDLLKDRNQQIGALQRQKLQLHSKVNHYKNYQIKITQNEQLVSRLQQQGNQLRREVEGWQRKYRQAEGRGKELENNLFRSSQEKEKFSTIIKQKNSEGEQLRQYCLRLESEVRHKGELQLMAHQQQSQISALVSQVEGQLRQIRSIEQELQRQRSIGNQFGCRVMVLSAQLQRLNQDGAVMSKEQSQKYAVLEKEYGRMKDLVREKNVEMDSLVGKITALEGKINLMHDQFSRMVRQVERSEKQTISLLHRIQQYQDYAKRIQVLGAEIDRLQSENKSLDQDAKRLRLKYSDNISFDKREEASHVKMVLMAIQIQALRKRVEQRQVSVEQLRKSILEPVRRIDH